MGWFVTRDLYADAGTSLATSGITSEVYNVKSFQDAFTLQFVASNSTCTVQGSNDEGRTAAPTNWSTITTVLDGALVSVDPGFAWIRCQRSNSSEPSAVILGGWQRSI